MGRRSRRREREAEMAELLAARPDATWRARLAAWLYRLLSR